jgi:hypothetical protein
MNLKCRKIYIQMGCIGAYNSAGKVLELSMPPALFGACGLLLEERPAAAGDGG